MFLHPPIKLISCVLCALLGIVALALVFAPDGSGSNGSASAAPVAHIQASLNKSVIAESTDTPTPEGCVGAYHYLKPHPGAGPANGGVATLGQQIWFDMMIHSGDYDLNVHQAYLTFTYSVLQNVSTYVNNCTLSTGVSTDPTVFDLQLQNETCNGLGPNHDQDCLFRGMSVPAGDIAFASGAWVNPTYHGPDFRVAEIAFCVAAPGLATIHWQFTPPDPEIRNTEIVDAPGDIVSNDDCYKDYIINAVDPEVTPAFTEVTLPTRTRTPTSTVTPTPSDTPTSTLTYTPSDTPLTKPTYVSTYTPTPARTPVFCIINLDDVKPSDYFYEAVRYMYCNGIITGYSDYTFKPYAETTRAQLCKIVALAEGWQIDNAYTVRFSDVPPGSPFFAYIMAAYTRNVISGYSDGTFQPGNSITRAQLSKIIMRAQQWPVDTAGGPHFTDVPPNDTFYQYIETVYNRGAISGYADRTFRPGDSATRGQISKIVYNAIRNP